MLKPLLISSHRSLELEDTILAPFLISIWSQAFTMVAWFKNTFSMSSSSRLHLLMFSSSCLKVIVEAAGAAAVVVVLLVRLAPAPEDDAKLVKAPEVDELEVGRVRVELVAA